MRILLVEDHDATRREIKAIIDAEADWQVVAEAATGEAATGEASRTKPDLIVMDIALPGMNGMDTTREILKKRPRTRVLMLSNYSGYALVQTALQAGAQGYVRKERTFEELIPAISAVAAGKQYFGEDAYTTYPPKLSIL